MGGKERSRRQFVGGVLTTVAIGGLAGCQQQSVSDVDPDLNPGSLFGSKPDLRSISAGETKEGHIDQQDPQDPEYGNRGEPVTLELDSAATVEVTMQSSAFEPFVVVTDAEEMLLAEDNAQVQHTVQSPGTYTIWASSETGTATGSYMLSVKTVDTPDSTVSRTRTDLRSIAVGEAAEGEIDETDPRDPSSDGRAEPVELTPDVDGPVAISMESNEFDTQLVVTDSRGVPIVENDDGGSGTDSKIRYRFQESDRYFESSGTYTIWAGSASGTATGVYTLRVTEATPNGGEDVRSIDVGETAHGWIDGTDPRTRTIDRRLSEPVTFAPESETTVAITMQSDTFDPYLEVIDVKESALLVEDDNSGSGTDARLQYTFEGGRPYTIWAGSVSGTATGPYTLRVVETSPESGEDLRSIDVGETAEGRINGTDPRDYYGGFGEPVTIVPESNGQLTFSMESSVFEPRLLLTNANGTLVAESPGSDTSARLQNWLMGGTEYTIWASSYVGTKTGPYTLSVEPAE